MSRRKAKAPQLRHNWQFTGNREPSAWLRSAAAVKLRWKRFFKRSGRPPRTNCNM